MVLLDLGEGTLGGETAGVDEHRLLACEVVLDDGARPARLGRHGAHRAALDALAGEHPPQRLGKLGASRLVVDDLGHQPFLPFRATCSGGRRANLVAVDLAAGRIILLPLFASPP